MLCSDCVLGCWFPAKIQYLIFIYNYKILCYGQRNEGLFLLNLTGMHWIEMELSIFFTYPAEKHMLYCCCNLNRCGVLIGYKRLATKFSLKSSNIYFIKPKSGLRDGQFMILALSDSRNTPRDLKSFYWRMVIRSIASTAVSVASRTRNLRCTERRPVHELELQDMGYGSVGSHTKIHKSRTTWKQILVEW